MSKAIAGIGMPKHREDTMSGFDDRKKGQEAKFAFDAMDRRVARLQSAFELMVEGALGTF